MNNLAVVGLGFGDEGKGCVTEYLCSRDPKNTIVVRFSGGQQAGHKVCKGDLEHIFSNFGSGTLSGCPTYWSEYCTFDPIGFWNEFQILREKGIDPKIYIHPNCAVTTVYDILVNRELDRDNGTVGTGVFRTKKRHFTDGLTLSPVTIFFGSPQTVEHILEDIRLYYDISEPKAEIYLDAVRNIRKLLDKNIFISRFIPTDYPYQVFEGSQGLMLDEHIGHMPHCTPSDITPRNAMKLAKLDEIFLVTRAYQTRHGNGPMTNEKYPVKLINTERETNSSHIYQGEFRKSVLDLDQLIHAKRQGIDRIISKNTKVSLVVTCMDQLKEYSATVKGRVQTYDERTFIDLLGTLLCINGSAYINTSPFSNTIKFYQ